MERIYWVQCDEQLRYMSSALPKYVSIPLDSCIGAHQPGLQTCQPHVAYIQVCHGSRCILAFTCRRFRSSLVVVMRSQTSPIIVGYTTISVLVFTHPVKRRTSFRAHTRAYIAVVAGIWHASEANLDPIQDRFNREIVKYPVSGW